MNRRDLATIKAINNNRRGTSTVLIALIVMIVLIFGTILWYWYSGSTGIPFVSSQLQDSEISNVVSFLKINNLQAAVIQKIYKPNGRSNWIVKPDGQKILLDNKDLGFDGWGQPNYMTAIAMQAPLGIYILKDQAEIAEWDHYKSTSNDAEIRDISMYVNNHSVDPFWHANANFSEGNFWYWESDGGGLSPNGKYAINLEKNAFIYTTSGGYGTEFLRLDKVVRENGNLSYQPISLIPGTEYLWSPDSQHLLLQGSALGVYDVANATTSYLIGGGHIQIKSVDGIGFGKFVRDASGALQIKKVDGSILPWGTLRAAITSDGFLETLPTPQQGIRLAGFIQ